MPYFPEIRFADIDAMGHVNNATYLSYFEQARMHFFRHLVGGAWDWNVHGILVAKNEIEYLKPIHLNDKIRIEMVCEHIGTKSFTLSYNIMRVNTRLPDKHEGGDELCSRGRSVLVSFNHQTKTTEAVPVEWRQKLKALMAV